MIGYNKKMRFLLPVFLAILFLGTAPVNAQDSTLPGAAIPAEKSIDEQLGITQPNEKKRKSTGNLKRDYALKYYDECIQRKHPYISQENRELLCGCTSQRIESDMAYNDIVAMFEDEAKAPEIHRDLLRTAYADCIRHPVRQMTYKDCMEMDALKVTKSNHRVVCKCTSDTMARFLTVHGDNEMAKILSFSPDELDPLGTYLEGGVFQRTFQSYLERCIDLHVFGYE